MFAKRRMNRIFRPNGRTLIVAMDHVGFVNNPLPGLIRPKETVRRCVAHGADAIMTTMGTAQACMDEIGDAGLILTIPSAERPAIDLAVDRALRMGADAIKLVVHPFRNRPDPTMLNLTWLGAECAAWGMPLLAEPIPGGWEAGPEMRTPEVLAAGARVSAEAGADLVKTFATQDPSAFGIIAENCPVPVVVLGGAKTENVGNLLRGVRAAMDHGAAGVAIGRNIWGHPQPDRVVSALAALLHENASVEEAARMMI